MIKLAQPALALNSFNVPGYEYSMQTTWKMPKSATVRDVVYWIQYASDHAPGGQLKHVILNSHGAPGQCLIGKNNAGVYNTIDTSNVGLFSELKSKKIGTIWIIACQVAKGMGKLFCSQMAAYAGCSVVASEEFQTGWWTPFGVLFMPKGDIDDYEGKVYRWDSYGNLESFSPNGHAY